MLILGCSPYYFLLAHLADLDPTVALFITLSLFSFLLATSLSPLPQQRYLYLAYCFSGLALLTKGLIGIVIPALVEINIVVSNKK